ARIVARDEVYSNSDIIVSVNFPSDLKLKEGQTLICLTYFLWHKDRAHKVAEAKATLIALDAIPRITRAQPMDVLSSQATIAGYEAVILGAELLPILMPMLSTAAGMIKPVEVLVIGAGVAGLQAIATAKRLGARITGYDVRESAQEEIRSLGAQVLQLEGARAEEKGGYAVEQPEEFLKRQQATFEKQASRTNLIITSAVVPGRKAPVLITKKALENMPAGSVVIDLAAQFGGNTEVTKPDEIVEYGNAKVVGYTSLPARKPRTASMLFSKNIFNLLGLLIKDKEFQFDFSDQIINDCTIVYNGELRHPALKNNQQ
ncbi:MAG: NAD(P) transhydrogenase subunit alpha, partial [Chlorobi bacterium]|nr:NAD(P) transhydrogenase subunit alpha [Chlorobiota bacterium]